MMKRKTCLKARLSQTFFILAIRIVFITTVRTKAELEEVVNIFEDSEYRYLHISCHGSKRSMHTTLDEIPFKELGTMLRSVLNGRRLFLTACSMANISLAKEIIPGSRCFSMIGPKKEVGFNDAAILWSSFYHLMFKSNSKAMKHSQVRENAQRVSSMYHVQLNYYHKSRRKRGFTSNIIKP